MQTFSMLAVLCLLAMVILAYFEPARDKKLRESCQICGAGRYQKHHPDCQWKDVDTD